ncbi:hypothetical protein HK105_204641 [Polyrhizophydium stewartii]|uniref:Ankyrin repeat protein n=1 Tax=Polyrhizophydium stewartii TaxID=2732419 RepID=A0ABR4N840_9FUNG
MADIRTNDASAAALAAALPPAQPALPHASPPPLPATPASTTSPPPPSTANTAARAVRFRPSATNEWDRMPAEIQNMILAHAGVLTLWVNGRIDDAKLDINQFKALLSDVFETDWQGDLTTLPFERFKYLWINESFWHLRTRSMHARVKALGFDRLNYGLEQAAILNGWTDLLDFGRPENLARNAAPCGSIAILEHLVDERKAVSLEMEHAELAAAFGRLDLLKWLSARFPSGGWEKWVIDAAAGNGHLDCVKWLHANRTEGCTTRAMDSAARNGHLDVVKFLHENRTEGCSRWAMDSAAEKGHANVVEFLHKNRTEGSIADAAKAAAKNGQLHVIQRIHMLAPDVINGDVVEVSAYCAQISALKWLINKTGVMPTADAALEAVRDGHFCMLSWFRRHMPEMFRSDPISKVGNESAESVVDWFERGDLPSESDDVMRLAIQERQIMVVKRLLQHLTSQEWHDGDLELAHELRFRPSATNEWDRMPAEIQNMILPHASPFTKFVTGPLLAADLRELPEQLREQVCQDANDANWQGDLGQLPPVDITGKALRVSCDFLECLKSRVDRSVVIQLAIRSSWTDMISHDEPDKVAAAAALEGDLCVLRDLIDLRGLVDADGTLVSYALSCKSFEAACFLSYRPNLRTFSNAAKMGHLEMLDLTESDLENAYERSHSDLLKWAYKRGVPLAAKSAQ